jgi:HNH endonuclease
MTNKEGLIFPLSGMRGAGHFAIIDVEDEDVTRHRWSLKEDYHSYLCIRRNYWTSGNKYRTQTLAREVWERHFGEIEKGFHIDHKDGNPFDNRVSNLRVATPRQNQQNQQVQKNNTSGMKGVYWKKSSGRWQVYITEDYQRTYFGCFHDLEIAARFYDVIAIQLWGEFARTNYPREEYPDAL